MSKAQQWVAFRRTWKKKHPPNDEGFYECWLCGKWVLPNEITLDHVIPRSRRPDLVFEETNIKPACWTCNTLKGSKVIDSL